MIGPEWLLFVWVNSMDVWFTHRYHTERACQEARAEILLTAEPGDEMRVYCVDLSNPYWPNHEHINLFPTRPKPETVG